MATKKKGNNKQNTAASRKQTAELKEGKRQLVSVLLFTFSIFFLSWYPQTEHSLFSSPYVEHVASVIVVQEEKSWFLGMDK